MSSNVTPACHGYESLPASPLLRSNNRRDKSQCFSTVRSQRQPLQPRRSSRASSKSAATRRSRHAATSSTGMPMSSTAKPRRLYLSRRFSYVGEPRMGHSASALGMLMRRVHEKSARCVNHTSVPSKATPQQSTSLLRITCAVSVQTLPCICTRRWGYGRTIVMTALVASTSAPRSLSHAVTASTRLFMRTEFGHRSAYNLLRALYFIFFSSSVRKSSRSLPSSAPLTGKMSRSLLAYSRAKYSRRSDSVASVASGADRHATTAPPATTMECLASSSHRSGTPLKASRLRRNSRRVTVSGVPAAGR
eukprot:PhM_4_TR2102/c3_g6_i2/m.6463